MPLKKTPPEPPNVAELAMVPLLFKLKLLPERERAFHPGPPAPVKEITPWLITLAAPARDSTVLSLALVVMVPWLLRVKPAAALIAPPREALNAPLTSSRPVAVLTRFSAPPSEIR
ncbi:hypothetical protein [Aquabacterium sp.]|uniref:hypothetical protein n=1 Tax=Aquabacterium sp. TaxID=1872578 RepID=UPI0025BA93C1|nr:hypothetical protein [Aquabacterium sp.]